MAKATKSTETRTVMKPVLELVTTGVTLTLTTDEAKFLADVLARVSGSPTYSRRRHQITIYEALDEVGVKYSCPIPDMEPGGIRFIDDMPGNPMKSR